MTTERALESKLRRVGNFGVGAFAAVCAAFIPRLAATLPTSSESGFLTVTVFTSDYLFSTLAFSILVGGVVLIFEWTSERNPREVFMSALAIPALISGFVNAAAVANQMKGLAEEKVSESQARALEEGIEIVGARPVSDLWSPWLPSLVPTVHAASEQRIQQVGQPTLGIQLREPQFWISLASLPTREEAETKKKKIGSAYGELSIEAHDGKFYVVLGKRALPYSEAVSKAIDVKRESDGSLRPALVGSDQTGVWVK
jgi:hypothetical protein